MCSAFLKRLPRIWFAALPLFLPPSTLAAQQGPALDSDIHPATHSISPARPPLIVIGFAGGLIRRTSAVHGEIAFALHLSKRYGARIQAEIFENYHGGEAHHEILRLIHLSETKELSSSVAGGGSAVPPSQATQLPRVILYGHSWGASEAVAVARQLQRDGIPVQLLVEVDGVRKRPQNDSVIPANVAQAINFYQTEGVLHGRSVISAADPASTQIIDNIHLTYKHNPVSTRGYPWLFRAFAKRHIEIESDPRVWNQVEALISINLPPA